MIELANLGPMKKIHIIFIQKMSNLIYYNFCIVNHTIFVLKIEINRINIV
jgi:hypothetical protein